MKGVTTTFPILLIPSMGTARGHPFEMNANFSEKLIFFTRPVCIPNRGYDTLVFFLKLSICLK